jgi:predicted nicotinamide N-methyase
MPSYKTLQSFFIGPGEVQLVVPDAGEPLQSEHSPYWGKVWPAALGLCKFLQNNLHYIQKKKVSEIAAGLGLPSVFTAPHAAEVYCSDIEPAAVDLIKKSVMHNKLGNVHCFVAGWNDLDTAIIPDILLLSDVNYDPLQFEELLKVLEHYLTQRCTIILSTPQRLMAKPFIEKLLQYCVQQEEVMVAENNIETAVSIFVMEKK